MSSRILIPFDNNPVSVSVKTASYTVPSGKYALIAPLFGIQSYALNAANVASTKTFTESEVSLLVNSEPFYHFPFTVSGTVSRSVAGTASYSFNIPLELSYFHYVFIASQTGGATTTANSRVNGAVVASQPEDNWSIRESFVVSVQTSGTIVPAGTSVYSLFINPETERNNLWVTSGTVLSCPIGCRYSVTEYNVIS